MEQLGDKSQQVAVLKTEISRMQQQNNAITDEVMLYSGLEGQESDMYSKTDNVHWTWNQKRSRPLRICQMHPEFMD